MIEEAFTSDEKDPNALSDDIVKDVVRTACSTNGSSLRPRWFNPPSPRTPPSRESIVRGRDLFLGRTAEKLECAGCHGPLAMGDGPSFVSQDLFNEVVFGGNPSERQARLERPGELPEDEAEKLKTSGTPSPTTGVTRFGRPT